MQDDGRAMCGSDPSRWMILEPVEEDVGDAEWDDELAVEVRLSDGGGMSSGIEDIDEERRTWEDDATSWAESITFGWDRSRLRVAGLSTCRTVFSFSSWSSSFSSWSSSSLWSSFSFSTVHTVARSLSMASSPLIALAISWTGAVFDIDHSVQCITTDLVRTAPQ